MPSLQIAVLEQASKEARRLTVGAGDGRRVTSMTTAAGKELKMPLDKSRSRFELPAGKGPTMSEMLADPERYAEELQQLREGLAKLGNESKQYLGVAVRALREAVSETTIRQLASYRANAADSVQHRLLENAIYLPPPSTNHSENRRFAAQLSAMQTALAQIQSDLEQERTRRLAVDAENSELRRENAELKAERRAILTSFALGFPSEGYQVTEDDFEDKLS
ncbi:MAG: hypothetical protein Q7T33_14700 [Dehalococcoidia bacterium]|nr:hypothetical protein [Dehalococcoidia bacterium]